ncbi:MAG: hypothetical protein ACE5RN_04140 [Nitrosopumilaceae archaeon]
MKIKKKTFQSIDVQAANLFYMLMNLTIMMGIILTISQLTMQN